MSLDFDFTEHYVSQHEHDLSRFEDTDVVIVMQNDILDLDSAVCDNILLQIPMQVLTEAERNSEVQLPQGEQWTVMSESQLSTSRKDEDGVDPRLAKLKDFFDNSQKNSQDYLHFSGITSTILFVEYFLKVKGGVLDGCTST